MYQRQMNIRFGSPLTPVVKKLIIINVAVFIVQQLSNLIFPSALVWPGGGGINLFTGLFALSPLTFFYKLYLWQVFTYMFLHGGFLHIFFNMLILWMVGSELERYWGSRYFLKFYLLSGLGAGFCILYMNHFFEIMIPTLGASGAIYGLMAAFALVWPNREVLLYFVIPIKVKYLMIGLGLFSFFGILSQVNGRGGGISHIGHLGGLLTGLLLFWYKSVSRPKKQSYGSVKQSETGFFNKIIKQKRLRQKQKEIETRIKAKKIIDKLLDKIASQGISSLSVKEKRDLEWARKNYYPDNDVTFH